jgi:hypothetical protein
VTRYLSTLAVLAALTTGCKQQVLCPALGSCGGPRDVNGFSQRPISLEVTPPIDARHQSWVLAPGHPSCSEDLFKAARDVRLAKGNVPMSGTPYPEPALFDWCVLLVTGAGSGNRCDTSDPTALGACRVPPAFYYDSGPIGQASIKYDDTGHFSTGITRTGTFTLIFPAFCVRAFGAGADVCKQLEAPLKASGEGEGSYFGTVCSPNTEAARLQDAVDHPGLEPVDGPVDPGGCFCRFNANETGGPSGTYEIMPDQHTILHLPGTGFPQKATFCQEGDRLQLTGADGLYLFDQLGVRTLDLVRVCGSDAECTSGHCELQPPGAGVDGHPGVAAVPGICGS